MPMWELVRLADLNEDQDGDDTDEATRVGRLSREDIRAMLREAEALEAGHAPRAPHAMESGIRLVPGVHERIEVPPVVVPPPPPLPAALEAELDDAECTLVASVLPASPVTETADDEIARVLDFDWEACAAAPTRSSENEPFVLVTPTATALATEAPTAIAIARRTAALHVVIAFAAAAAIAFAVAIVLFALTVG
jgi:hypothetical protein